jgi:hypothetical protein
VSVLRSSIISRLIGAAAALWLGAGSAWAGSGGSGDAESSLSILCNNILFLPTCPSFSSLTATVLELAALEAAPPEIVRAANSIVPTVAANAVNPPAGEPSPPSPFPPLSNLVPLAFISSGGKLAVTNPGDESANSFFYAATDGLLPSSPGSSGGQAPTTLYLVYDFPPQTKTNSAIAIAKGLDLADICLPLTSLSGYGTTYTETPSPTLLRVLNASGKAVVFVGSCSPPANSVFAPASSIGLNVTLTFESSLNSAASHAVIEVQVPLLLTKVTDPSYFLVTGGVLSLFRQPIFVGDECGSTPTCMSIQPPGATVYGMSPTAAHFTAKIAGTIGGGQNSQGQSTVVSVPAVDAYLAIAIDGETLVSQLLPQP